MLTYIPGQAGLPMPNSLASGGGRKSTSHFNPVMKYDAPRALSARLPQSRRGNERGDAVTTYGSVQHLRRRQTADACMRSVIAADDGVRRKPLNLSDTACVTVARHWD